MSTSTLMKAVPYFSACDAEDLKVVDWPKPDPSDLEVRVRVKAFGLNFADTLARKGQYKDAPRSFVRYAPRTHLQLFLASSATKSAALWIPSVVNALNKAAHFKLVRE